MKNWDRFYSETIGIEVSDVYKENTKLVNIEEVSNFVNSKIESDKLLKLILSYRDNTRIPYYRITSIPLYVKETMCFDNKVFDTPEKFNKIIRDESVKYVEWFKQKLINENIGINLDIIDFTDVSNWFKGAMGEYFWLKYLTYAGRIFVTNELNGQEDSYEFRNVTYTLLKDFGVDLVAEVYLNKKWHNVVIQVKNWTIDFSQYITGQKSKYVIDHDIPSSAHYVGTALKFIPHESKIRDILVCWFGDDNEVSKYIAEDEIIADRTIIFNRNTIKKIMNNSQKIWSDILKDFKNLANYD